MGQEQYVPPPTRKIVEVATIIVVPVLIGMALRATRPVWAARMERPIRIFAVFVLLAVILAAIGSEWDRLPGFIAAVGGAGLVFNLLSIGVGYGLPRLLKLERSQSIAIAMEIGIHNYVFDSRHLRVRPHETSPFLIKRQASYPCEHENMLARRRALGDHLTVCVDYPRSIKSVAMASRRLPRCCGVYLHQ